MSDENEHSTPRPANTVTRIAVGAVVGIFAVATVTAAAFIPVPETRVSAESITVAPATGDQSLACPGPIARLSNDQGAGATDISMVGGVSLAMGSAPLGQSLTTRDIQQPDNTGNEHQSEPVQITGPSEVDGQRLVLGAAQSEQHDSDELIGFTATACQESSLESWLVGGATTTGRTSFLYLSNPTDVSATVDLSLVAEQGPIDAPGARGIVVPAGSQRVISLAGLAPNVTSPVVHVESTGGAVAAWIQQSIVRGLAPGGFEITGSVPQPSTTHVIPGVQIAATTAIAERLGAPGSEDLQAILRAYVPGTEATAMAVTAKSEAIGVPDVTFNLGATAGVVTDFVLRDIPDGTYTLSVTADHPVLLAARTSLVSGAAVDFAWYQSVAPQNAAFVVTAPNGPFARLHLFNPGSVDGVVQITTSQGEQASISVPAGTAAGVPLGASLYEASATVPIVASVGYLNEGLIAGFPLNPVAGLDGPVEVYPR